MAATMSIVGSPMAVRASDNSATIGATGSSAPRIGVVDAGGGREGDPQRAGRRVDHLDVHVGCAKGRERGRRWRIASSRRRGERGAAWAGGIGRSRSALAFTLALERCARVDPRDNRRERVIGGARLALGGHRRIVVDRQAHAEDEFAVIGIAWFERGACCAAGHDRLGRVEREFALAVGFPVTGNAVAVEDGRDDAGVFAIRGECAAGRAAAIAMPGSAVAERGGEKTFAVRHRRAEVTCGHEQGRAGEQERAVEHAGSLHVQRHDAQRRGDSDGDTQPLVQVERLPAVAIFVAKEETGDGGRRGSRREEPCQRHADRPGQRLSARQRDGLEREDGGDDADGQVQHHGMRATGELKERLDH